MSVTAIKVDGKSEFADVELPETQSGAVIVSCDRTKYTADERILRVPCKNSFSAE